MENTSMTKFFLAILKAGPYHGRSSKPAKAGNVFHLLCSAGHVQWRVHEIDCCCVIIAASQLWLSWRRGI